jgi:hypothetical protein
MVEDAVVAVTALKGAVVSAVGILVEIDAELDDVLDVLSSLAHESVDSVNVVLEAACYHRIVLVILDIVGGGVVDSGDTSLSEHRVAQRQLALAEDEDAEVTGKVDGCIETCGSAACDYNVIVYRHSEHVLC